MKLQSIFIVALTGLCLIACESNSVSEYKKVVGRAAWFKVKWLYDKKSVFIRNNQVDRFKQVLLADVQPDTLNRLSPDTRIEFYDDSSKLIGSIEIVINENPSANFKSDSLSFGFRLPYQIGMMVSELRSR